MCIEIFGCSSEKARSYAVDLGIALQLTNILRDVGEDAARGRVYLPAEDLAAFGVDESDLRAGRMTRAFARLMRFQAGRARAHYLRARAALGEQERRRLYIAEIMGDIYYALLCRIESGGFDVFRRRTSLSPGLKMGIALKKFAQAQLGALTH
jgi:phytoene synthase